jgi:hypothetical protein
MFPDRQITGYPPFTETEERLASGAEHGTSGTERSDTGRSGLPPVRLGIDEKIITDAISAVIEKYRAQIGAPTAETREHALDVLDALLLDVVHRVLSATAARRARQDARRVAR